MRVPSGLQPIPLETVVPFTTGVSVPPESSRYSVPSGSFSLMCMEPTHTRPAGSTAASLNWTPSLAGASAIVRPAQPSPGRVARSVSRCPPAVRIPPPTAGHVQQPAGNVCPDQGLVFRPPVGSLAEHRGHVADWLGGDRHPNVHHGKPPLDAPAYPTSTQSRVRLTAFFQPA